MKHIAGFFVTWVSNLRLIFILVNSVTVPENNIDNSLVSNVMCLFHVLTTALHDTMLTIFSLAPNSTPRNGGYIKIYFLCSHNLYFRILYATTPKVFQFQARMWIFLYSKCFC